MLLLLLSSPLLFPFLLYSFVYILFVQVASLMSVRFSGSLLSAIVCYILLTVIAQKINFDWLIDIRLAGIRSRANCNCYCETEGHWGTCIVLRPLLEDRGRITESIRILVPVDRIKEKFSDHDETSPSIAAVSAPSVACSMLAVQQQKRLCRQFLEVSAARRGCHTMKHAV